LFVGVASPLLGDLVILGRDLPYFIGHGNDRNEFGPAR
jgi:hypothetical protein